MRDYRHVGAAFILVCHGAPVDRVAWKVFIGAGLLAVFGGLDWLLGGGVATTPEREDYATRFWRLRSQVGRRVFMVTAPVAAASFLTWLAGRAF